MGYTTQKTREHWRDFRCDESKMVQVAFGPTRISVAESTTEAWKALAAVLLGHGYTIREQDTGGYICRKITGGSQPSLHSYGIAVDVNWQTNPYLKTPNRRPVRFSTAATQKDRAIDVRHDRADTDLTRVMIDDVLAIVTNEGKGVFAWGGNFQTCKDCMHFQLDVTPAELAQGVAWARIRDGQVETTTVDESTGDVANDTEVIFATRRLSVSTLSSEVIAAAQASQQKWEVPASVTLAQFILESDWGRKMPGGPGSNNPFGMKAAAGQPSVGAPTHEVLHGETIAITARFRKFSSLAEAFDAHGALLAKAHVYAPVMVHKDDPDAFADALTRRYATDPNYGSKLRNLMQSNNLYQYDRILSAPRLGDDWIGNGPLLPSDEDLTIGAEGEAVRDLQQRLVALGYPVGKIDGIFGTLTRGALVTFQADNGLVGTGQTDAPTRKALAAGRRRRLDPERTGANASDLAADGSVVVNQADNVKLTGLVSSIVGTVGMINSIFVNGYNHVAAAPAAAAQGGLGDKTVTTAGTQIDQVLAGLTGLAKIVSGKNLDLQSTTKAAHDLQNTIASLHGAATAATQSAPGKPIDTVIDMLPGLFHNGSNWQSVAEGAATLAGSLIPGFGGSAAAVGIGLLIHLFSNRIIDARTKDHQTAANLAR